MATMEQIEILMSDVGPVLDPLAIDAMPEAKCWGIAMEEDLSVLVEFDEQKNCLVLACELGAPPPGDRTALYELLLQMNYHWGATGGTRMAIGHALFPGEILLAGGWARVDRGWQDTLVQTRATAHPRGVG